MRAMVLDKPGQPLRATDLPPPIPGKGQVLIKVHVCGLCRTDLHVVDGDLTQPKLPIVPGHQIVGRVADVGDGAKLMLNGHPVISTGTDSVVVIMVIVTTLVTPPALNISLLRGEKKKKSGNEGPAPAKA